MASSVFSSDKEIEQHLLEIGNRLQEPPTSVDELLPILDQAEHFLAKVEQSPPISLQNALLPTRQSLVSDHLFKHTNVDVKVAVAACISEITRITAPDAPYDDEEMKDVFKLIVSSFQNLADKASRSYTKRTSILETVAKVRSCVVMLDLECDNLINEMFEHFLKAIRDDHPGNVFSSMETIMILVVEESEDISFDLLSLILNCVRKTNEDVMPIARKLAERVLESCAAKIKPYLIQAVKSLGISLDDYNTVVASICEETSGGPVEKQNVLIDEHVVDDSNVTRASMDEAVEAEESNLVKVLLDQAVEVDEKNSIEAAPTQQACLPSNTSPAVSNGVKQPTENDSVADSNSIKKQEKDQIIEQSESIDGNMDNEKEVNAEKKEEQSIRKKGKKSISLKLTESSHDTLSNDEKKAKTLLEENDSKNLTMSPRQDSSLEANLSFDNGKEIDINISSPMEIGGVEPTNIASPSPSGSLPNENRSKITGRQKKDTSMKQAEASNDDVNKKASEVSSDSEDKPIKLSGKKAKPRVSNKDQTKTVADASKKSSEASTLSGVTRKKRSVKKITSGNTNEDETPTVADASKKTDDIASDSEAEPLTRKEKVDDSDSDAEEPLRQTIVKRKRTQGKSISKKDLSKTSTKNDDKEAISSPKSAKISTKVDRHLEDTPTTNNKRKRTPSKELVSVKEYGEEIVGSRVKVWWPQDHSYYTGVVRIFDPVKKKHKVFYDDGDVENLNLQRQKWEFIDRDSESVEVDGTDGPSLSDSSGESPAKKGKSNSEELTKHGKTEVSSKRSGGSSSKSKVAAKKSNKKSKDEVNVEKNTKVQSKDHASAKTNSKSVDVASKPSNKSKNNDGETPKSGKSKDDASKTTSKSKEESSKGSKSKQETPKASSISKGKQSKTGTKSVSIAGAKSKSGSSKTKNVEDTKEDSSDMDKTLENTKGKSPVTSKAQGSDAKSGKKRRR